MPVLVPEPLKIHPAETIADVQAAVAGAVGQLLLRGRGTKPALSRPPAISGSPARTGAEAVLEVLDLSGLSGILEYNPGEFVFTALAGTPLTAIEQELAQHGQYLPFNPPLAAHGATLGGTVAAGLSGAGRQRYGGLRDFLLGARFIDGQGRLVRSGGKVVKNAAGFDQHKLLVGSLGRLGALVEVSFKVFPQPRAYATLRVDVPDVPAGIKLLRRLATTRFDLEALDLCVGDPTGVAGAVGAASPPGVSVLVRLGGQPTVLPQRLQMLAASLGGGAADPAVEAAYWRAGDSFTWLPGATALTWPAAGWALVKTPVTLDRIGPLDAWLAANGAQRRYTSGGNLAWIGWPHVLATLEGQLQALDLGGLVLLGATDTPLLGRRSGQNLLQRVKATLDPFGKFLSLA